MNSIEVKNSLFSAYGKVFLVRKMTGADLGKLYAMKVLKKAAILQKAKTAEHIKTERQVLEAIRQIPFLVSLHYAFQSDAKLHLVMGLSTSIFIEFLSHLQLSFKIMSAVENYLLILIKDNILVNKTREFISLN